MEYQTEYAGIDTQIHEGSTHLVALSDAEGHRGLQSNFDVQGAGSQMPSTNMHGVIKRAVSTPNVRALASGDLSDKKKNKLGYHRTAVACGHCRRRKIRCVPAIDDHRCQNCIRLKKDCHFFPVDQPLGSSSRRSRATSKAEGATGEGEQSTSDQSPGLLPGSHSEHIDHANSQLHTPPLTQDGVNFHHTTGSASYPDPSPPRTYDYSHNTYEPSSFHSTPFLNHSPRTYYHDPAQVQRASLGHWSTQGQQVAATLTTSPYPMTPMSMSMGHNTGDHAYQFSSPSQSYHWPSSHALTHQASYASAPGSIEQQHQPRSGLHPSFQRRMTLPLDFHDYSAGTPEYLPTQGAQHEQTAVQYGSNLRSVANSSTEEFRPWSAAQAVQHSHISAQEQHRYDQGWFAQPVVLQDVKEEDDHTQAQSSLHQPSHPNLFQHNPG